MSRDGATQREVALASRLVATMAGATVFLVLAPLAIRWASEALDGWRSLGRFGPNPASVILGGTIVTIGLSLVLWTAVTQITRGRGTPVPMMPPLELLTRGPFALCRNPLWFGALSTYLGLAIASGVAWGVAIVAALVIPVALYHGRIEERELEARFGQAYLEYRARTPFMIPRLYRQ